MGGHLLTYMHFVRQGRLGEFDYIEIRPHVESGTVVIAVSYTHLTLPTKA